MQNEQGGLGEIDKNIRGMNVSTLIPYFVVTLMRKGHLELWEAENYTKILI